MKDEHEAKHTYTRTHKNSLMTEMQLQNTAAVIIFFVDFLRLLTQANLIKP